MRHLIQGFAGVFGLLGLLALYALVNYLAAPAVRAILAWALGLGDAVVLAVVLLVVGLALGGIEALGRWWGGKS